MYNIDTQLIEKTSKKIKGWMVIGGLIAVSSSIVMVWRLLVYIDKVLDSLDPSLGFLFWFSLFLFLSGWGILIAARVVQWWYHE